MKKILSIMLSISFAFTLLFTLSGCNDTNSSLANNINRSVDRVKSVLEQTPEVSNEELIFEEIMSLSETKSSINANIISSKTANKSTTTKINKKTYNENPKTERLPFPNLTRQIVKKSNSNLDLVSNQLFSPTKVSKTNRLSSKRVSDISRLTSSYYTPRRVNSVNYNNSSFVNYLGKVEDLYLMMNDAVCANDNINSCKNNILEYCDLLGMLSQQLKSKDIKLNDEQINSCNDLLGELGDCTNKVTSSRNDVQNSCSNLRQSSKDSSFKIDKISSNYVKVINCLDSRECYYENMLSCIKQLQCLLSGNCYNSDSLNNKTEILSKKSNTKITDIFKNNNISKSNVKKSNTKITDIFKNTNQKPVVENTNIKNNLKDEKVNQPKNQTVVNKTINNTIKPKNTDNKLNNQTESIQNNRREIIKNKILNKNNTSNTAVYGQSSEIQNNQTIEDNRRNTNIDTYKEQTIKPNVIDSRQNIPQNQTNQNVNNNQNKNFNNNNNQNLNNNQGVLNNNNQVLNNNNINPINPIIPNNGVIPNVNTYGTGYGINGVPGIGSGVGVAPGVGLGGVANPGVGGGIVGGVGTGYGIGSSLGGRYNGIHHYENGIINPYRNTDTYKLALETPLPSETRRNFKPFSEINSGSNKQHKLNLIKGKEISTEINGDLKTTTKAFQVS